ncbi:uncharacterized protein [Triticum aestivum]|uniref:uncharacterized protein n=1 Tax=Triticum aestivum TaxID=4565 RepID=UPI001D02F826|nr:uncharacterized protein LOC123054881 [Triticum aestivum]
MDRRKGGDMLVKILSEGLPAPPSPGPRGRRLKLAVVAMDEERPDPPRDPEKTKRVKGGPRFEDADEIVNYIDFGVELATRVGKDKPTDDADNSSFQIAANWQANKNFLVKGKLGPSKSSVALALKSWWKPMFTFSFIAVNDHAKGTRGYGFGIHVDDQRDPDSSHLL